MANDNDKKGKYKLSSLQLAAQERLKGKTEEELLELGEYSTEAGRGLVGEGVEELIEAKERAPAEIRKAGMRRVEKAIATGGGGRATDLRTVYGLSEEAAAADAQAILAAEADIGETKAAAGEALHAAAAADLEIEAKRVEWGNKQKELKNEYKDFFFGDDEAAMAREARLWADALPNTEGYRKLKGEANAWADSVEEDWKFV
jgi:hypothetical protein